MSKIKVAVPMKNPHVCYIGKEYKDKIEDLKKATGMSLYNLICTCSGQVLKDVSSVKKFKEKVRKNGFRTIGEWAESLIDMLHDNIDELNNMDLSSVKLRKKEKM